MPDINRIRVNNVKYNFGTQFYDDFTMRMYGKNTLYDLANGGGKSVLMLLLLQNLIPNCTLDDKQPVEKLFRTGSGNTTIHSLIEWKLDACDVKDGYRYMTTGFCARKAKDSEEDAAGQKVASIEYFNYCIFYRQYNKNDIINLPLIKDKERISYQALRNYLKDLEHHSQELIVKVFDKKGEYQRFISGYGLHESQWEIVRGINKTEGHVRTYFETNYKTTRKVVEDLLIEEIIEKAFLVKTERDEDGSDSMAKLLMDIKDQLAVLAGKKKDIASYDHQTELINLLSDKVNSFMDIYKEQDELVKSIAGICVAGEEFAKNDEEIISKLDEKRTQKNQMKNAQRERIECLKVSKDKRELEALREELTGFAAKEEKIKADIEGLQEELYFKESVNEYIDYLDEKKKYDKIDAENKIETDDKLDEHRFNACVYNIKMRIDYKISDFKKKAEEISGKIQELKTKNEYQLKLLNETEIALAVAENNKKVSEENIRNLSNKLSDIAVDINNYSFDDIKEQINKNQRLVNNAETGILEKEEELSRLSEKERQTKDELSEENNRLERLEIKEADVKRRVESFDTASNKLENIFSVYAGNVNFSEDKKYEELKNIIRDRITNEIIVVADKKKEISKIKNEISRLKEDRIVGISEGARKVIEYIQTRHQIFAMYGMDYLSALSAEKKESLLASNPELPYGVLVKEFEKVCDDQNIMTIDTGCESIVVYDLEMLEKQAFNYNDNAFAIHRPKEAFLDKETSEKLAKKCEEELLELEGALASHNEMLQVEQEDLAFVLTAGDAKYVGAKAEHKDIIFAITEANDNISKLMGRLKSVKQEISDTENCIKDLRASFKEFLDDRQRLIRINELTDIISENEKLLDESLANIKRLTAKKEELRGISGNESELKEAEDKLLGIEKKIEESNRIWTEKYEPYFVPGNYPVLTEEDIVLETKFMAYVNEYKENIKAFSDRKLLMDTISGSMNRILKNIEKRGIDVDKLQEANKTGDLLAISDGVISEIKNRINSEKKELDKIIADARAKQKEYSHLEGSIDYAIRNIEAAFGEYKEEKASMTEIISALKDGEVILKKLTEEAASAEAEFRAYQKKQGYMMDLYKDARRIVERNNIDISEAVPIKEDKDKLREIFEDVLIRYDKAAKLLDRAKNELLRFKTTTAETLTEMGAFELSATIRDDVLVPADYEETKELLKNLSSITGYIGLEKDRIEKSLVDMELLKSNFEEQCLQRCLDVKTELDKLPKLSRIILEGEAIQMVGLTVPYVKEEFMRDRMSAYIDKIVSEADGISDDKDRMRYIRNCLTLKKLFGVIVTDMNQIKLSLYKRERIKEQSRYLKYEEAVGSTGQSQGIYIQFLISIINYISGMYVTGNEDVRTKTIFIDNPFGAAKDVYIWEPIFALLKVNNVQLIVPARGATPAITGRFDVNYVLGQQMTAGKQVTVVVNYTSKTTQEELEYKDLEFEQATFDFV